MGNGEIFSDLLKVAETVSTESNLEVGEEVRINRGGGSFLRGPVQQVLPDGVIVRGKKYPFSAVQTTDEVEAGIRDQLRAAPPTVSD